MNRVSTGELARINQAMAKAGADAVKKRKEQEEQRKKYEEERQKAALEQSRIPNGGGSAWEQYRAAKAAGEVKNASEFIQKRDARNSAWNKIGVDTLEDDMNALSKSIGASYGDTLDTSKYYTQEQLNASSNQVKQVRDRLRVLQDYYNTYGGTDEQKKAVGDQIKAYDDEIQFFGDLANHYGSYKNEADFNYRNDKRLDENYLTYNYDINTGKTKLKDIESYLDVINGRNAGATHAAYERAKKQYGLDGMSASEIKNWLTQEYQLESFAVNNADRMRTAAGYKSLANSSDFTQGVLSGKATENPTFEDINAYQTELEQLSDKMTGRVGGGFTKEDEERYNYLKEHPVTINNKLRFYDDYNNGNGEYHASPLPAGATDYSGLDNDIKYAVNGNRDLLTDEEASTYYYLLGTKGADAANEYLDYMQTTLDFRNTEQVKQAIEEFKNNKHFRDISTAILNPATYLTHAVGITSDKDYEKVKDNTVNAIYSAISVPMNVIGGGIATIGDVSQRLSLISKGDWAGEGYNPYANYNLLAVAGQQARGLVAKDIEENTSMTLFGQNICSQLYQSLMSGADSAFGMATLGKMYTVSMYGSAATSKAAELYESGASNSQIFYESMLSGIAEMTFEYLSLENLSSIKNVMEASPTTLKKAVKMILVQNGVEASEEVFTEIANTVIDEGIRKYDSDYNQKITEYVRDGMSRDEAVKKAAGEVASNITWAGIGGAFSGLASSSLTIMGSYSANKEMRNQQYSAIDPGTADGLVTNAKNIDLAILNDVSAAIKSGDTERAKEIISEGKDWYDSLKAYGKDKYGKTQGSEISASVDASIDNLNKISKLVAEGKIEASAIDGILANAKTSAETKDVVSENNEKLYSVLAKENISNKDIERNILKDKGTLAAFERLTGTKADGATISQKRASARQTIEAIKNTTETLKSAQNAIESGKTASEGRLNAVKILNDALEANKAENSQLRNSETAKSKETKEAIDRNVREYSFLRTTMNYVREGGDLSGFTNPSVANVSSETSENTAGTETSSETAKETATARPKNDGSAYSDDLGVEINIRDGQSPESAIAEEVREIDRTVQDIEDAVNMTEEEKTEQIDALKSRRSSLVTAYETLFDLNEMAKYAHGEDIERIAKELSKPLKKLGLKIETEENISAAEGQKSGAYFDKNTNTIHLSKSWGSRESVVHLEVNKNGELVVNRDANVSFDRAVTQTVAHEIAHGDPALVKSFIKSIAGTSFDAFDFAGRLEHPNDSTWESSNKQKEQNWREYRDAYLAQEMSLMSDKLSDDEKLTAAEKKVNDAYIYEEIMADMFGQAVDSVDKNGAAGDNVFVIMNRTEPKLIKRIVNALKRFAARLSGKEGYLNEVKRQQAERLQEVISRTLDRAYGDVGSVESAKETGSGTENDGNRYSVAGANSRTADWGSLENAIRKYNHNVSMDTIREKTGWWLGKDGKWRYEISDDKMRFNPDGFAKNPETVGDYVKHDQLFRAYPWIADVKVNMVDKVTGGTKETNGKYSFDGNFIELKNGMAPEKAKYVLAHELQHAVQYSEGFVHGTSPKTGMLYAINFAYDLVKNNPEFVAEKKPQNKMKYLIGYLEAKCGGSLGEIAKYYYFKNYGETEARSVSKRLDMTEAERRAIPIENNGEIFSYENVFDATIDNLRAMGYNEKQITDIMKKGVSYDIEQTNVQESDDEVGKRRRNDRGETGRLSEADTNRGETGEIYRSGEVSTTGVSEKAEVLDSGRRLGELRRGNGRTDISGASLGSGTKSFQRLNEITKPEKRFSLTSTVEQTKDLIAVHNLTTSKLEKTLDLGGFPMPSIAIIKAADGHAEYGDVSVVFGKDTIDPQKSSRNKVYGGDAWTPTFPKIEYKANEKAEKRIRDKYYELSRKYGYDSTRALYNYATDLSSELDSAGGEKALKEKLYSDTGMMQIYLEDSGKGRVANVNKETKTTLTDEQVRQYDILIDTVGKSEMNKYAKHDGEDMKEVVKRRKEFMSKNEDAIREAFEKTFIESGMSAKDAAEVSAELAMSDLQEYVRDTYNYMKNGKETIKSEFDPEAMNAAIKKAADGKEYHEWVNKLFGGAEEKSGIRNSKDPFTASGNRRSFEALHWETSLENIVSAMLEQDETGGAFVPGTGIFGASTKKFGSISDIKRDSARLRTISKADYSAMKEQFEQRMTEIARTLADPKADNYFLDNEYGLIVDAVRSRKTIDGIFNYLRKYNGRATEQTANDIAALVRDISEMPTGYFEAKPQRAVGFDEVKVVILPDNASDTLISRLRDDGVNTVTYPAGDENARLEALNGVENVRFSLTRANDEYMKAIKSGDEKTAQRLVDEAAENAGYNTPVWHGTTNKFTVFRLPNEELGVHFGTKGQARTFAGRGKNAVMQKDVLSIHNPIRLNRDLGSWYPDYVARELYEMNILSKEEAESVLFTDDRRFRRSASSGTTMLRELLSQKGYDAIIYPNYFEGKNIKDSYLIWNKEQVKSANPITYDNDGNVIPLTERFDSGKSDIRWSLSADSQKSVRTLEKDNAKLKQKISDLKQEQKLTHGKKLSRDALLKNIQNLVADYGSTIKADALYDDVTELYDIVYNRIVDGKKLKSVDEIPNYVIEEKLDKIADTIIEYAVERDTTYDEYADLLKELKRTKITVPRSNRADAGVEYGNTTWAEFRKRNFGKVAFTNTGIPIDSYYMELTDRFPELFPDDITHPGEQAARIVDIVNTIKRGLKEELPIYDGRDERVSDAIKSDILDMLKNTDKLVTFADKAEQRVQDARLAERMHYGSELARVKRERDENVAKIKERYAEQMEKRSENQKKTVATQQIVRKVNEFTSLLKRPTQKNHVTEAFRKPLLDFLGSLDIVSKEYTAKQKKELASGAQVTRNVNLARQSTFDEIQRILLEAERDAQNDAGTNDNAVDETDINAQEKKYIVDSGVLSLMYEWNKKNYGKPLSEMSSEQLQELNTILNITKSVMANIKRIYDPTVGLAARSDVVQSEMKMSRWNERAQRLEAVKNWFRDKGDKYFNYPAMDAYRFYNLVDSPEFTKQLDSFRHAQDKFGTNVDTFLTMMEDAVGEKGIPESWHGKKAQEVTLDLSNGKLRATPAQIMTLYLLLQQEDSRNCLLNDRGGAVIGAYTAKGEVTEQKGDKVKKKNVRVFNKQNDPLVLTEADISKISGAMTPEMLDCANKISKILSGKAAQLGNEVSMAMWGYKKYTTENYFPMRVFETGKPVVLDPKTEMNLLGLSLAKERTHYAGKPLIVEDIFDAVGRHLTNMAQYNAFAQVIDDARRMYTLRTGNGRSLKRLLVAQYGDKADNYYRNLLNNLSGAEITTAQGVEAFSDKLLSHYKAAAVAKNLSVVFKQPMSIFRAMPEFSSAGWKAWHSFKDASPTQVKAEMAEMLEHSGIAKLKNWGASENMTKKSFEELYNNTPKSWLKRANEKLDSGAEFADMWTWSRLWRMSKAEVEATGKYTKGSEEYFKAVNDKFSQVIGKTQVVQSALDSSAAVQNNSLFSKFFYAFQNEPLKQYNYLSSCIDDVRRGKKGAKAKLAKVVGMSVVNAVMTASISTFFALLRGTLDRDDDDEKWDDILKSVTLNAALDLVSGGLAPIWQIVETAISAIESGAYGNTVERMDLASLTDLGGLLNKYFISQSGGRPNLGTLQDIINVSSELFGWSGKNFLRDFKGGVDRVIFDRAFFGVDFSPKFKYNYLKLWKDVELTNKAAVTEAYYDVLRDAVDRGRYSDYVKIKRDMIYHGYTETKIKNAVMKSSLMDDLYELKKVNPGSYKAKVNSIVSSVSAVSSLEGKEFEDFIESAMKRREREDGGSKTDDEVYDEMHRKMEKEVKEQLIYIDVSKRAAYIKKMLKTYGEYGITEADILKVLRKAGKA